MNNMKTYKKVDVMDLQPGQQEIIQNMDMAKEFSFKNVRKHLGLDVNFTDEKGVY